MFQEVEAIYDKFINLTDWVWNAAVEEAELAEYVEAEFLLLDLGVLDRQRVDQHVAAADQQQRQNYPGMGIVNKQK